jgi:hypothetical protein
MTRRIRYVPASLPWQWKVSSSIHFKAIARQITFTRGNRKRSVFFGWSPQRRAYFGGWLDSYRMYPIFCCLNTMKYPCLLLKWFQLCWSQPKFLLVEIQFLLAKSATQLSQVLPSPHRNGMAAAAGRVNPTEVGLESQFYLEVALHYISKSYAYISMIKYVYIIFIICTLRVLKY